MRREKSVYIGPDKGGQKAYAVLREAMRKKGVVAVGKVAIRDREHLVAIEAEGEALLLTQVYYGDEISSAKEVPNLPTMDTASPREVEMAGQVIDAWPLEQTLDSYADGAQEALGKVLEAKETGQPLPTPILRAPMPVDDLMSLMQKMVEGRKQA